MLDKIEFNNSMLNFREDAKKLELFDKKIDNLKKSGFEKKKLLSVLKSELENTKIEESFYKKDIETNKEEIEKDIKDISSYKKRLENLITDIEEGREIENEIIDKSFLETAFSFDTEKMFENIKISFKELEKNIAFEKGSDFKKRNFEVSGFIQIGKDKITIVDQKVFDLIDGTELVESEKYKLVDKEDSIYIEKVENSNNKNEVDENEKENNPKFEANIKKIIDIESEKIEVNEKLKKLLKNKWGCTSIEEALIYMRKVNSNVKKSTDKGFTDMNPGNRYSQLASDLVKNGVPHEEILELINSSFTSEKLISGFKMTKEEKSAFIDGMIDGILSDVNELEKINNLTLKSNEQYLVDALMFNYTSNSEDQNTYLFEVLKEGKHNIKFNIDYYNNDFYENNQDKIIELYPYLSQNQKIGIEMKYPNYNFNNK